ncbi:MAG: hypothetical protein ACRYGR_07365 [Janthinobacterium lividum]
MSKHNHIQLYNDQDQTTSYRAVDTQSFDDKTIIIKSGLNVGDMVVASGQLKLKDKIKVKVVPQEKSDTTSSTSNKVL